MGVLRAFVRKYGEARKSVEKKKDQDTLSQSEMST